MLLEIILPRITSFGDAWIAILPIAALLVQSVGQQAHWPSWVKRTISVTIASVLGAVYFVATGQLPELGADVAAAVVHWFIAAVGFLVVVQALYAFFKAPLAKLEQVTTATPKTVDADTSAAADAAEADDPEMQGDSDPTRFQPTEGEQVTDEELSAADDEDETASGTRYYVDPAADPVDVVDLPAAA